MEPTDQVSPDGAPPTSLSLDRRRRAIHGVLVLVGLALVGFSVFTLTGAVPIPTDVGVVPVGVAADRSPESRAELRPLELTIPGSQVKAAVHPVDSVAGVLQVPEDPAAVGWWSAGAAPGATGGTVVIDGHIDSAVSGPGALFHLADLGPGDPVSLRTSSGATVHYTVRARRVFSKADGLPAEIFAQDTASRLVLISCGGPFDSAERSYLDNIVVYATPTEG